jgi:glycerophosphoryl diester phosphodiesterase
MVEFDIVLTKDNQVVVYHDYAVCIKSELNENKYIDIGVHQLTYEELKKSKVYICSTCTSQKFFEFWCNPKKFKKIRSTRSFVFK